MTTRFRIASICTIALLAFATNPMAESVSYEVEHWCLSYEKNSIPSGVQDVTMPGSFPRFRLPWPPDENSEIVSEWQNILVSFSKDSSLSRPARIRGNTTCTRIPEPDGLVSFVDKDNDGCRLSPFSTRYEAASNDEPNAAIWMHCPNDPDVTMCMLFDLYQTGWRAEILLPKQELSNWDLATQNARYFFQRTISDCENSE